MSEKTFRILSLVFAVLFTVLASFSIIYYSVVKASFEEEEVEYSVDVSVSALSDTSAVAPRYTPLPPSVLSPEYTDYPDTFSAFHFVPEDTVLEGLDGDFITELVAGSYVSLFDLVISSVYVYVYNSVYFELASNGDYVFRGSGYKIPRSSSGSMSSVTGDLIFRFSVSPSGSVVMGSNSRTNSAVSYSGNKALLNRFITACTRYNSLYDYGYNEGFNTAYYLGAQIGYRDGLENLDSVYSQGYSEGYSNGYNLGQSEQLTNPVSYFLTPVHNFLNTNLFGSFSLGVLFNIVLFIAVAIIFIRMFSGG